MEELHGGLSDVDQQRIVDDFGNSASKLRLLLASDVASEGLNLHYLCHRLIHFDLPWSLMVFQQRNGRIDRYGQTRSPQIVYLQTDSRNEVIQGDTRILTLLRRKSEQAFDNIGDFFAAGVERLKETANLEATVDARERLVELRLPDDLKRRFLKLPAEVRPDDGVVLLTADPERMQRALEEARKQTHGRKAGGTESTWPRHQLLWTNSPVVHWLSDRVRAEFGRHTAPGIGGAPVGRRRPSGGDCLRALAQPPRPAPGAPLVRGAF